MPTTVMTVRGIRGDARAYLLADPDFAYVGRGCAGWRCSAYGNPFRVGMDPMAAMRHVDEMRRVGACTGSFRFTFDGPMTAAQAVELYRLYVLAAPGLREGIPRLLKGKRLGCWCGSWSPGGPDLTCHAVVLAKLADGGEHG